MKFENANVLITGGASGIGRIIGQMALQKGAKNFIIWDINKESCDEMIRAVLPDMLKRNHGHICNITSAGGMLSNPKMSVYAASKWAATGWKKINQP